ncbi:MAG: gliding motility protein GldC [Cytophagales bacterium]|nr:gliding motility protein GldC [Cytophagales bacterium]MDW8385079.1 gliding motility protein GldC [Flammeovirgaceae bacterium]
MRDSEIRLRVELDDQNIPEKIFWHATDAPSQGMEEVKAISVNVWDNVQKETLRLDLWTKDMPIFEMKRFCIDMVGGLAISLRNATNDKVMADMLEEVCDRMVQHLNNEYKRNK